MKCHFKKKRILTDLFLLLALGSITFFSSAWVLKQNHYFLFDDIAWIYNVKFSFDIKQLLTILPTSRYNDRPVRTLWFRCLYQLFGMDCQAWHLVTLLWHVVNTFLMLLLARRILEQCGSKKSARWLPLTIALFFGIYPKNLLAVVWLAGAANDLLCGFFCLLSLLCYLRYMDNRGSWADMLASLAFYILAMRSKEAGICLPIIVFLYELYVARFVRKEPLKLRSGFCLMLIYMLLYLAVFVTLPVGVTQEGTYKQVFSISTVLRTIINYIRLYFAWDDGNMSYDMNHCYTKLGNIGLVICLLVIAAAAVKLIRGIEIKRNAGILLTVLACGLAMAPLLVLPNVQHMLYFYFPAIFLSILFGTAFYYAVSAVIKCRIAAPLTAAIACACLLVLNHAGGGKQLRECFILWGEEAFSTVRDIERIEPLPPDTHVYLSGADSGANVFNYGPGYILNILYNDTSIITELIPHNAFDSDSGGNIAGNDAFPSVVWEYADGHVKELLRTSE